MADSFKLNSSGLADTVDALKALAPDMRKGPAKSALRAGMAPILAAAVQFTPELAADVYRGRIMVRRAGTLKRSLVIRNSKDTNATGDVGVIVNYKPLTRNTIRQFKENTGRRGADNPDDNFYWKFVNFATKRNKNPSRALQKAGDLLVGVALPIVVEKLGQYITRLNARLSGKK